VEPAGVQLARQFRRGVEAAGVRAPEWAETQRVVDPDGHLAFERLPGGLRVARPDPPAPRRDAQVAVAMETPGADIRPREERALIVELMPLDSLEEIEPVPFVRPPGVHPRIDQADVLPPVVLDVRGVQRLARPGRD